MSAEKWRKLRDSHEAIAESLLRQSDEDRSLTDAARRAAMASAHFTAARYYHDRTLETTTSTPTTPATPATPATPGGGKT